VAACATDEDRHDAARPRRRRRRGHERLNATALCAGRVL
jgi:hypothetical protein